MDNLKNKYSRREYDEPRNLIDRYVDNNLSWEKIKLLNENSEGEAKRVLSRKIEKEFWPKISLEEWYELVEIKREFFNSTISCINESAIIHDETENNNLTISKYEKSSWGQYKKKLREKGFKEDAIETIEKVNEGILRRLSPDTTEIGSIKGMVIGNVQSGKTANMGALMAMAADNGWNMFIILSGIIENLRKQTLDRLFSDLTTDSSSNILWKRLDGLSKSSKYENNVNNLDFREECNKRYFTVCLKNSKRLEDLIGWMTCNENQESKMRVLVIDDEADQASINTADIYSSDNEKKKINKLISRLVNGKRKNNSLIKNKFTSMNYIGYTATPYANVLNEGPGEESLYPSNFITILSNSNEYFGPQEIFGTSNGRYSGMDIVRVIEDKELETIKAIHSGDISEIPEEMKDAICWLICCVSAMRISGWKKPVSMLVHTSHKIDHHNRIFEAIKKWFKKEKNMLARCENIWERETGYFSKNKFYEQYPNYGEEVQDYLKFSDFKMEAKKIIDVGLQHIIITDDNEYEYSEGVHLCVDNSQNNKPGKNGEFYRIEYPVKHDKARAFIVIGGTTLSRGLTIEGLVSTYFLRTVGQADTLMQMGRWFGYRKGYELLPRIWITDKSYNQFKFLADLDLFLRDEIKDMERKGIEPNIYGPRVKNSPGAQFIKLTSNNKMQSAVESDMDYSGAFMQTYLFSYKDEEQKNNLKSFENFISKIGKPKKIDSANKHVKGNYVWKNIDFAIIKEFLKSYIFSDRSKVFMNIDSLIEWIDKVIEDNGIYSKWNVVLAGKESTGKVREFKFGKLNLVERTRKKIKSDTINIGVLSSPKDMLSDVDVNSCNDSTMMEKINSATAKDVRDIRRKAGVEEIPQMVVYIIDKDSKASKNAKTRSNLDSKNDLVGFCLNIPGMKRGVSYAKSVRIDLKDNIFNDKGDLEENDEN